MKEKRKEKKYSLNTKNIVLKAEVLEVMLYGCVAWTLLPGDFDKLREAHRGMLLRCLNA